MKNSPVAAATAAGAEGELDTLNVAETGTNRQGDPPQPGPDGPFAENGAILWRAGLTPIPLTGEGDGKPPSVSGFTTWKRRPGLATLAKWAQRWPDANIGIVTGNKLVVVDVDTDDPRVIAQVIRRFGDTPLQIRTPSGGLHLLYASSGERCTDLRPGLPVDIKGVGGYVVAPPSVRPTGKFAGCRYEIVRGSWADLPRLPLLRPGSLAQASVTTPNRLRAIEEGRRNTTLFRMLLRHAPRCDDFDALLDVARTINDDCVPPLPDAEVLKTAKSAWRYEVEGLNWAGRTVRVHVTADEIDRLVTYPHGGDMALLLLVLRRVHWGHEAFAVSPKAMAAARVISGWGPGRYRLTVGLLIEHGLLRLEHRGGSRPGDPNLFSFATLERL